MKRQALLLMCLLTMLAAAVAPAPAHAMRIVEVRVHDAPPALRVERIPPSPGPGHYWIGGHWGWEHGAWAWNGGHWEVARAHQVWVRPEWVQVGGEWVFHAGYWAPIAAPAGTVEVTTDVAPPPAQAEVIVAAPSPNHFWIPGYYRWDGHAHVWVAGRWEVNRPGQYWAPAHWVQIDHHWHFQGGHWQHR